MDHRRSLLRAGVCVMPSLYWRKPENKLKKCSEFRASPCDPTETDLCCEVIPCSYCLRFEVGYDVYEGDAPFSTNGWLGTVAGANFFAFWERNYYTNECEFVVTLDDEEVYRKSCYEGQSCRDSSDSVAATIGYDEGTLSWTKVLKRPLAHIIDPYTGCETWFCGDCECTCEALCVDVREVLFSGDTEYAVDTYSGELPDISTDECGPPIWEGTVGSFTISLTLSRDEYGNCILTPTVNYVELDSVLVDGCEDLTATFELEDGSSFTVRCKRCSCAEVIGDCICGRPLGQTLRFLWSSANGTHGDAAREFELSYGMVTEPQIVCSPYPPEGPFPAYTGSNSGTYPIPQGGTRQDTLYVMLVCCIGCPDCLYNRWQSDMDIGNDTWYLSYMFDRDCECPAVLTFPGLGNGIDYQIFDVTIIENEDNCP